MGKVKRHGKSYSAFPMPFRVCYKIMGKVKRHGESYSALLSPRPLKYVTRIHFQHQWLDKIRKDEKDSLPIKNSNMDVQNGSLDHQKIFNA